MSAMNLELDSFISKLLQLNSCGFYANLNLNANGGRVFATLSVDLSDTFQYGWSDIGQHGKRRSNRSRNNRRLRRKQQREASTDVAASSPEKVMSEATLSKADSTVDNGHNAVSIFPSSSSEKLPYEQAEALPTQWTKPTVASIEANAMSAGPMSSLTP